MVSVSDVVTITAGFSEAMTATPTISITGIVTNVIMTPVSGTNSYTYAWDTSSGTLSNGTYTSTVSVPILPVMPTQVLRATFTIDASSPTVTLTDTDSDNLVSVSEVVTITAGFSEAMTATPTISITGIVTNVIMTPVSGTILIPMPGILLLNSSNGTYTSTVSGTDLAGNAYSGTETSPLLLMLHRLRLL